MSSNDFGENNPYRAPGDGNGQGEGASTPPPYGQQPYSQDQQPPAYGQQQPPMYGGPHPGGQAPQGFGPPAGMYPDNKLGGWSLGLALASIVLSCGLFTGIPAIIVGVKGLRAAAAGTANNRGMSMTGVVIGSIMTALSVLGIVVLIIVAASGGFAELSDEFAKGFEEGMNASQADGSTVSLLMSAL